MLCLCYLLLTMLKQKTVSTFVIGLKFIYTEKVLKIGLLLSIDAE